VIYVFQPPIRAITLGIAEPHPLPARVVEQAGSLLRRAATAYQDAGYQVQTLRLSTRPVFDDLADRPPGDLVRYAHRLQEVLDATGLGFCSLGTAQAARPGFPLPRVEVIADLLIGADALNATVQLATPQQAAPPAAGLAAAQVMRRLAAETDEGFGNFRFAALACVPPGIPFFPAAYHQGPTSLALGLQGAGIIAAALGASNGSPLDLAVVTDRVRAALIEHATPIVGLGAQLAQQAGVRFAGIDLSPAPAGQDSITAAIEQVSGQPLGAPGTLALAAALTAALKTTPLPTCGYNGLMLPVLEDAVLGQRWQQGHLGVHTLLCYSAVCGTGLDAIPLPGDSTTEQIARLLADVAALAMRLHKPLSARLFPVPGTRTGDPTTFTSPYLTNTCVKW
jgi:uncharacterized protein